jgi:hypothetical protein
MMNATDESKVESKNGRSEAPKLLASMLPGANRQGPKILEGGSQDVPLTREIRRGSVGRLMTANRVSSPNRQGLRLMQMTKLRNTHGPVDNIRSPNPSEVFIRYGTGRCLDKLREARPSSRPSSRAGREEERSGPANWFRGAPLLTAFE